MACSDCVFEVEARSVKVFINGCKNVRLSLRGKIITHTLELYKCEDCAIDIGTKVWTAQLDLCKRCRLEFASREDFQTIISAGCHEVKIRLADMAESVGSASVDFGAPRILPFLCGEPSPRHPVGGRPAFCVVE